MIPQRLTVKNFMCYRDNVPPLDLESIHLACLCGDNGHGKTALLDAMTWALWGETRTKAQEELVHQGQQDMAVDLEFVARDQRYRVSRRFSRTRRNTQGTTVLELQLASPNGYVPITGNTIRETEAKVRDILHMDYETFVNTAFLLQGQADMFTRSSPTQRKQRLAEVLDLSYYEALEERAKDHGRTLNDRVREADVAIGRLRLEVASRPERQEELRAAEAEVARVGPEAEAARQRLEGLRAEVDSLRGRRAELAGLSQRLASAQREAEELERQVHGHRNRVAGYQESLDGETETRRQYELLEEARAELERLDRASFQTSELEREKAELSQRIAVQSERLSSQAAQLQTRISGELEPRAADLDRLRGVLQATAQEESRLAEAEEGLRQRRDEVQDLTGRLRYLEEAQSSLRTGMEETRRKFDMLEHDDAVCPLCQQALGTDGQDHLRREYETEGREAKARFQQHESEHKRLTQLHHEASDAVSKQEADLERQRRRVQAATAAAERDMAECRAAQDTLGPARRDLDEMQATLRDGGFAQAERLKLADVDAGISALGYDGDGHRRVRERVRELEPVAERQRRLAEATEQLPLEREALETAGRMLDRRRQEAEQDEARRETLSRELYALPSLEAELASAESAHRSLEQRRRAALVRRDVLVQQLDRLSALEVDLKELESKRRALVEEKSVYDELAVAFGKNGIQALIIEQAIPYLQDDANELLGRLTESRMTLKLQLGEGRKDKGVPSEVLHIQISDEVGTRNYETFSGGEAFRINFALRIALSKLLARRSGAPLPILFIDEGFGTQDSSGQDRLIQAIQSIQADFEKIIVITHVEQVKEAFPVRIEVTKTGNGSTFVVV